MTDILKLTLSFLFMVALLRWKLKIGYVMMLGAAALAAMYVLHPHRVPGTLWAAISNPVTLELLLALSLIRMLEMVLREHGAMKRMMEAFRDTLWHPKAVLISMPMLIGMLPSVGGAYFSAPMVEEASRDQQMTAVDKAFVNYWYRHPWELVLPLYPGVLLASAITGVELRRLLLYNMAPALLMFALGFVSSMRGIGRSRAEAAPRKPFSERGFASFIPIASVLLLVIALGVRLYVALAIVLAGLVIHYRYGARRIWATLRHGLSMDVVFLITGVMLLKETMQATGAVGNISAFFASSGIPLMPTLVLLPFMVGILTGITVGYVGATFPLIISLAGGGQAHAIALAFASGFAGVLLSPVHVCLVLTEQYFKAGMRGIYRKMLVPSGLIILLAAGLYIAA